MLKVANLSKRFGDHLAVDRLSFAVPQAQIMGILGPNGAGKSTTIQMLLGLLLPSAGSISYFGLDLGCNRTKILEQINFCSPHSSLPWGLTVHENLSFISHLYRIKRRHQKIEALITRLQLTKLLHIRTVDLSSGELNRLNLAKALLNSPKVLLLDEPSANLDPSMAGYIRNFLMEQRNDFKTTMIITSHNMSEVELLCDRILFIDKGALLVDDTPKRLIEGLGVCRVNFQVADARSFTRFLFDKQLVHSCSGGVVTVSVNDTDIPRLLATIAETKLSYHHITIEKPSLADYFLRTTRTNGARVGST